MRTLRRASGLVVTIALCGLLTAPLGAGEATDPSAPAEEKTEVSVPRLFLDRPARVVQYQLDRLSNEQLIRVERRPDDPKYGPVYQALLTREGLAEKYRQEAVSALARLEDISRAEVLLNALGEAKAGDRETPHPLLGLLFEQSQEELRANRELFRKAVADSDNPLKLVGAYGAMVLSDADPWPAWRLAKEHGHEAEMLRGLRRTGRTELQDALFKPLIRLAQRDSQPAVQIEALALLGETQRNRQTAFKVLVKAFEEEEEPDVRLTALQSLQKIPRDYWSPGGIELLARSVVSMVRQTDPQDRTKPQMIEAIRFGEELAAALPREKGKSIRRDLRSLGVRVVTIETVPEQMLYDLNWFVVESGSPVRITLRNPDQMPHNLLISEPGTLQEVGLEASSMAPPSEETVKPYVPDLPAVLHATDLLEAGEEETLTFTAPDEPGEYIYVCTFPGHWTRMYGVMLVVEDIRRWEKDPTVPTDPLSNQPFASRRFETVEEGQSLDRFE